MPIRLAIINDYEVVVRGLAEMLSTVSDAFDVVELDTRLPVENDVDIALYDTFAQTQGDSPAVSQLIDNPRVGKVVVYSWNVGKPVVDAALRRGVAGYLSKALGGADLAAALVRIHAGEVVVPEATDDETPVAAGDWPGRAHGLTPREAEIIALITQGLSNQDIATKASLSINSVKSYIRTAYRKMGVTSRTNAVLWGLHHGFTPDHLRDLAPDVS
jgi:two-component system, NarL family, response regulator LiaR